MWQTDVHAYVYSATMLFNPDYGCRVHLGLGAIRSTDSYGFSSVISFEEFDRVWNCPGHMSREESLPLF